MELRLIHIYLHVFLFHHCFQVFGLELLEVDFGIHKLYGNLSQFEENKWNGLIDWTRECRECHTTEKMKELKLFQGRWMEFKTFGMVHEDPQRPGYPDRDFFMKNVNNNAVQIVFNKYNISLESFGDREMILSFDPSKKNGDLLFPSWMQVDNYNLPVDFDAASELYEMFIEEIERTSGGVLPRWLEPFNEPDNPDKYGQNFDKALEFHVHLFERIRKRFPSIKVGAPCSMGTGDLEYLKFTHDWEKKWRPSLDIIANNDLDFFSFHSYDRYSLADVTKPYWNWSKGNKDGRWNANMDLIQAYYQKTHPGRVLPVVMSEFGAMCKDNVQGCGRNHQTFWGRLRGQATQLFTFLERPQEVGKASNYLRANWERDHFVLFDDAKGNVETDIAFVFHIWRKLSNDHKPVHITDFFPNSRNPLRFHAFVNTKDNEGVILLLNYNNKPHRIGSFNLKIGGKSFQPSGTGKLSCTYLHDDIPILEEDKLVELPSHLEKMVIGNSALCALQIPLPAHYKITSQTETNNCYSPLITTKLTHTIETSLQCKKMEGKGVVAAKLRISIGWWSQVGDVVPSALELNGCEFTSQLLKYLQRYTGENHDENEKLSVLEIKIDPKCVGVENSLTIHMKDVRGHIMSISLVVESSVN